jgi:hypothetical protein
MKTCKTCSQNFEIEKEDEVFYEMMQVSVPENCPECRLLKRLVWRNEKSLYRRACDLCKKNIITIYAPESPYTVYCRECFHGDGWDPLAFGVDFDSSRPFLEQFRELQLKVPRLASFVFQNANSEYVNGAAFNKNCYMMFVSDHNEDSFYSYATFGSHSSSDLLNCNECDSCYESVTCTKCYQVHYSEDCTNSQNLLFCKNCTNCQDCIGSVNLKNVRYAIFNQVVSKEEYEKALAELTSREKRNELRKKAQEFFTGFPVKYFHGLRNVGVTGDYVQNSKNSKHVFDSDELEDCKYINHGHQVKDSEDAYVLVDKSERCFEVVSGISLSNVLASYCVWHCYDAAYTDTAENSHHLFGCVGLRKKEYCILNKQYSKEEYEELRKKIIEQMKEQGLYGDFFPAQFSPFAYNETVAPEYHILTKEEALKRGFTWREEEKKSYETTLQSDSIPLTIKEVSDDIIKEIIECAHKGECSDRCTTAFRITADEFTLYKKLGIPLPALCFNCRHAARIAYRNPRTLWRRSCMCTEENHIHREKCQNEFETSYAPERKEQVYCETCYQQEIQ